MTKNSQRYLTEEQSRQWNKYNVYLKILYESTKDGNKDGIPVGTVNALVRSKPGFEKRPDSYIKKHLIEAQEENLIKKIRPNYNRTFRLCSLTEPGKQLVESVLVDRKEHLPKERRPKGNVATSNLLDKKIKHSKKIIAHVTKEISRIHSSPKPYFGHDTLYLLENIQYDYFKEHLKLPDRNQRASLVKLVKIINGGNKTRFFLDHIISQGESQVDVVGFISRWKSFDESYQKFLKIIIQEKNFDNPYFFFTELSYLDHHLLDEWLNVNLGYLIFETIDGGDKTRLWLLINNDKHRFDYLIDIVAPGFPINYGFYENYEKFLFDFYNKHHKLIRKINDLLFSLLEDSEPLENHIQSNIDMIDTIGFLGGLCDGCKKWIR